MDAQFWINAWTEGRTAFHQLKFNEKLLEYFPKFNFKKGQRVLVPLCGKTKDMLWLQEQQLQVRGVELYEDAVAAFFSENGLPSPKVTKDENFISYTSKDIVISCGDFFKLSESENFDFVYDRAALVALPETMRKDYTKKITQVMRKGGKCLLISFEYDPSEMQGPPFSVSEEEVHRLYSDHFSINQLERKSLNQEGGRLSAVTSLKQTVFVLEKVR